MLFPCGWDLLVLRGSVDSALISPGAAFIFWGDNLTKSGHPKAPTRVPTGSQPQRDAPSLPWSLFVAPSQQSQANTYHS